jgi:hypothetical protein
LSCVDRRVGIAFLLQPFICAVLGFVLFPFIAVTHAGRVVTPLRAATVFGIVTGIVSVLIAGIAALTFVRLRKRGRTSAALTMLYGAAFGNIPAAFAVVGTMIVRRDVTVFADAAGDSWRAIAFGTAIGVISSGVFWLMAGRYVTSSRAAAE